MACPPRKEKPTASWPRCALAALLFGLLPSPLRAQSDSGPFDWSTLPDIPDPVGFAGSYAGVSGGALLVAGGANFPDGRRPWAGGVKAWHDRIFVLDRPDGAWKSAGRLPRPLGYGVSLTHADEVICLGGGDATAHTSDAFALRWRDGAVAFRRLPPLPQPLANACGAVLRDRVYLAGGTQAPGAEATAAVWSLPLTGTDTRWERLPDIPGGPRMLAMAGAVDGRLLVCGGVRLGRRPGDRDLSRTYLSDAWAYTPGQGWRRVADLPHPLAAAPSPGHAAGQSHLLLFGGDDGRHAPYLDSLRDAHPGFRSEVLAYNTVTDRWSVMGRLPVDIRPDAAANPGGSVWAPVTTPSSSGTTVSSSPAAKPVRPCGPRRCWRASPAVQPAASRPPTGAWCSSTSSWWPASAPKSPDACSPTPAPISSAADASPAGWPASASSSPNSRPSPSSASPPRPMAATGYSP